MRKGWKVFWIVCGAMVAVGLVCCAIAWGLGVTTGMLHDRFPYGIGWVHVRDDDDDDDGEAVAEDIHESFTGVTEIDMSLFAGEVIVQEGGGQGICIDTDHLSEKLGFKCYMDGDELKLTSKKRLYGLNHVGRGTIIISIPEEMRFEEVSLNIGAGKLTVGNICAGELSVGVGAGEVTINDFEADEASFECGAGSIVAKGDVRSSADLKCGVGSIVYTASGREEEYNYDIECGIGEILCGDNTYSGLGRDQSINNHADKEISIEGGIGSIVIEFDKSSSSDNGMKTYHETEQHQYETETHHEEHE